MWSKFNLFTYFKRLFRTRSRPDYYSWTDRGYASTDNALTINCFFNDTDSKEKRLKRRMQRREAGRPVRRHRWTVDNSISCTTPVRSLRNFDDKQTAMEYRKVFLDQPYSLSDSAERSAGVDGGKASKIRRDVNGQRLASFYDRRSVRELRQEVAGFESEQDQTRRSNNEPSTSTKSNLTRKKCKSNFFCDNLRYRNSLSGNSRNKTTKKQTKNEESAGDIKSLAPLIEEIYDKLNSIMSERKKKNVGNDQDESSQTTSLMLIFMKEDAQTEEEEDNEKESELAAGTSNEQGTRSEKDESSIFEITFKSQLGTPEFLRMHWIDEEDSEFEQSEEAGAQTAQEDAAPKRADGNYGKYSKRDSPEEWEQSRNSCGGQ